MYGWSYRPLPPPRREYDYYDPYAYPYRERPYAYYEEGAPGGYEPLVDRSKYQVKHDESITTMDPQISPKHADGASDSSDDVCRILCIADIKGKLSLINELAEKTNASFVIHTGDFGFFGTFIN